MEVSQPVCLPPPGHIPSVGLAEKPPDPCTVENDYGCQSVLDSVLSKQTAAIGVKLSRTEDVRGVERCFSLLWTKPTLRGQRQL